VLRRRYPPLPGIQPRADLPAGRLHLRAHSDAGNRPRPGPDHRDALDADPWAHRVCRHRRRDHPGSGRSLISPISTLKGPTMKVKIDHEFCVGHARCFALEPEYIAEDERGRGVVREDAPEMSPETA